MGTSRTEKLTEFVAWAKAHITGDEKGQAQVFLDRLFQAFGQKGSLDVGGSPEMRIKKSTDDGGGTSFADYVWKPIVLIEMKKRGVDLRKHYRQAFDYWTRLVPNRPRYVVLCNFDAFHIYDFDRQVDDPVDTVALIDLPERFGPLAFLFPTQEKPIFGNDREKVTREAANKLAECYNKLKDRKIEPGLRQRFILQCLVALFAEDIGLLDRYTFAKLLEQCKEPADSYDLIGGLFEAMNRPGGNTGGRYKGVRYFNGGIFSEPARVELQSDEIAKLREASQSDWSKVSPEIFGTLFEHSMETDARHAYGAHYTSQVDILKIVNPTIVQPWTDAIEAASSGEALLKLLARLTTLRVLDPACGSGNFLYIAYRRMKQLESRIRERLKTDFPATQATLLHVNARQFFGMDITPFAIELAKVTMMLGRKLAIDELHIADEADLPLDNLDANFLLGDSLITKTDSGGVTQTPWPAADVIIGNPPFLDARKMTLEYGAEYVSHLERLYPAIPRRADLCTYWIRRAQDHLQDSTKFDPFAGRAGLVGTQNIRNNESREGGLDYVVAGGTIMEAVDNQPWSGEANVHVSIVNWMKSKDVAVLPKIRRLWTKVAPIPGARRKTVKGFRADKSYELEHRNVDFLNASLSDATDVNSARVLDSNREPKRCFEGQQPGSDGFRLDAEAYRKLKDAENVDSVVYPYLNGTDLLTGKLDSSPSYIIDFGDRSIIEVQRFPKTLEIVKQRVLPEWQANARKEQEKTKKNTGEHQGRLETWWKLKRRRGELIRRVETLGRYIACSRVAKRPIFAFVGSGVRPDSSLTCFALEDDYSFGILQSSTHWIWFFTKCSKLKSDFRYTPDTVFDTFPWPQSPTAKQIDAVAVAGREARRVRSEALAVIDGGLRAVYRTLELPGKHPLKDAHAALDAAVLDAYGFSPKKDLLAQLLNLNRFVAAAEKAGEPVTAPGVPVSYGDPSPLITADCIQP